MSRLIDADRLLGFVDFDKAVIGEEHEVRDIIAMIKTAPTVDAVEVVRCKECTHYAEIQGELKGECLLHGYGREDFIVESDDFCSCGKRRE